MSEDQKAKALQAATGSKAFELGQACGRTQGQIEGLRLAAQFIGTKTTIPGGFAVGMKLARAAQSLDDASVQVIEEALRRVDKPDRRKPRYQTPQPILDDTVRMVQERLDTLGCGMTVFHVALGRELGIADRNGVCVFSGSASKAGAFIDGVEWSLDSDDELHPFKDPFRPDLHRDDDDNDDDDEGDEL